MVRIRTAAAAAATVFALSGLLSTVPAQAAVPARPSPEQRVDRFFGEYRDAVLGENGEDPMEVREHYLTRNLNRRLDEWAAEHDADPVFRAQNVPVGWSVHYGGSGAGHTTVILTERWDDGSSQDVWYQVRLSDLVISDLEDAPS